MSPPSRQRAAGDPARRVAYDAIRAVSERDAYLNLVLPAMLTDRRVGTRDAAFATELAHGTLRLSGTYDAILGRCTRRPLTDVDPPVLDALRLGVHQLLSMRVPAHAAVATTVELVRAAVGERPVTFANAVLRRVAERDLAGWLDLISDGLSPLPRLAARHGHPEWVVELLNDALGADLAQTEALLAADNEPPRVTLVARPGRITRAELLAEAGGTAGRWSPYAVELPGGNPAALGPVADGRAGVQDEGSQLVAIALSSARVEDRDTRWGDLCAGPGGKAALLAGTASERGATVLASELQEHRARLVHSTLRSARGTCGVVVADATRPAWPPGAFDRVLVDAPCTGLGALRRRPEARWRRTPQDVHALVPLQRALLESALASVRVGGVVGYVTCSPVPAETRDVVDAVLRGRGDVLEEDARLLLPHVPHLGAGPHVQLWPHRHGTDAMFLSLLRRTG
jgi:16S rRNA (cytosine967-C5)-methyltransferase